MTKGRIISALILIGALAIAGSLYKFYFAAKLQAYKDDAALKEALEAKAMELQQTFVATDPDVVIAAWKQATAPFTATREQRGSFFNFADWEEHPVWQPTDGIVKYWYEEQAQQMLTDLYTKVREKGIRLFPPDVRAMCMIPSAASYMGRNVDAEVAHAELARLAFAIKTCELLLDHNVKGVNRVWLWKPRQATELGNLLTYQTAGCQVYITLPDLVNFFDALHAEKRYFSIDAIRLVYNTPGVATEPVIEAQFLITQAKFNPVDPAVAVAMASTAGADSGYGAAYGSGYGSGYGGYGGGYGGGPIVAEEPSFLDTAWRWFKRYILYTN